MIITGAPVEQIAFEEVDYWKELVEIMDWTETHVTSTIFLCWAAQASLYHFYGLQKRMLSEKKIRGCSGIRSTTGRFRWCVDLTICFWRHIPAIRRCLWRKSGSAAS